MILREVVERFAKNAPVCLMARMAMENILSAERLDSLFENAAERQENKALMFSTVAEIMGLVACKIHPSVHAAYQAKKEEVGVTAKALYDKLQRMEGSVSREVVRETAGRMAEVIEKTQGALPPLLSGYRTKILDGNHLRRTERRIKELRTQRSPVAGALRRHSRSSTETGYRRHPLRGRPRSRTIVAARDSGYGRAQRSLGCGPQLLHTQFSFWHRESWRPLCNPSTQQHAL